MKQNLTILFFILIIFVVPPVVAVNCGDTWQPNGNKEVGWGICENDVGVKRYIPILCLGRFFGLIRFRDAM